MGKAYSFLLLFLFPIHSFANALLTCPEKEIKVGELTFLVLQTDQTEGTAIANDTWVNWGPFLLHTSAAQSEKNSAGIKWNIPAIATMAHEGNVPQTELDAFGKKWQLSCAENIKISSILTAEEAKKGPKLFWDFFPYGGWNWVIIALVLLLLSISIGFGIWKALSIIRRRLESNKTPETFFKDAIIKSKKLLGKNDPNATESKQISYLLTGALKNYLSYRLGTSITDLTDSEIFTALNDIAIPTQSKNFTIEILQTTFDSRYGNEKLAKDKLNHLLHLSEAILAELKPQSGQESK